MSMNDEWDDAKIESLEEFLNSFDTPEKWAMAPIELAAPPMIEQALGYTGNRRFVAFYISLNTFEFGVDDGEFRPSDMSAWKELTMHPLVTAILDYPSKQGYWLLLERRPKRRLYVGIPSKVRLFLDAYVNVLQSFHGDPFPDQTGIASTDSTNIARARQKLRAWLDKQLQTSQGQYRIGCWHHKYGRFAEAVTAYENAADIDSELASNPEFNSRLAHLYLRLQRHSDAIKACERVLKIQPRNEEAISVLALSYIPEGRIEDAIELFKKHTQLRPDDAERHSALGMALGMMSRFDEAIEAYTEAARLNPNDANIRSDLAAMYAAAGDTASAFREYRVAVKLGLDREKERELLRLL
jgi:tetratricopeptide (TPR) repeat protein